MTNENRVQDIDQNYGIGKIITIASFQFETTIIDNADGVEYVFEDHDCEDIFIKNISIQKVVCINITNLRSGIIDLNDAITPESEFIFQSVNGNDRFSMSCEDSGSNKFLTSFITNSSKLKYVDLFKEMGTLLSDLSAMLDLSTGHPSLEGVSKDDREIHGPRDHYWYRVGYRMLCILLSTNYYEKFGKWLGVYQLTNEEVPSGDRFLLTDNNLVFKLIEMDDNLPNNIATRVTNVLQFVNDIHPSRVWFSLGSHPGETI